MRILFIGDIFGKPGRRIVKEHLEWLREELRLDFCIANAENAAAGKGLTSNIARELFDAGVDLMTTGNHCYDNKDIFSLFASDERRVLRPLNYPPGSPGPVLATVTSSEGENLTLVQLLGRIFMPPVDSPFTTIDRFLEDLPANHTIIVDFHAEATSEKQALARYLDGRVAAVIGTHTHVQTADEKILPQGTAAITDVGMTGPHESIIGADIDRIMQRFLTALPSPLEVGKGDPRIQAVLMETDSSSHRTRSIERYSLSQLDLCRGTLENSNG